MVQPQFHSIFFSPDGIQPISEGSKYKSNCRKNGNYNKSFGCHGEEWITVELQAPFCDRAVVKMRETVFAFAKIQSHLRSLPQLHQSNVR